MTKKLRRSVGKQRSAKARKRRDEQAQASDQLPEEQLDEQLTRELPQEFLNRELEWLEFNERVLHEALDPRTPLLERVRFFGIFNSNLDEFCMKRIGALKRQVESGAQRLSAGLTPVQQLSAIRQKLVPALLRQAESYRQSIVPELAANGVYLLRWDQLAAHEREFATQYFKANVFPVLTPLAVDPGLPFPFLSNLSTSLGVTLKHPDRDEKLFARIKVPKIFPQWIQLRGQDGASPSLRFVSLMDVIAQNLRGLFPDMETIDIMPFRITRNADIERDEDDTDDLLEMIAEEIKQRRFAEVVRLEHGPNPDPWMLRFLMDELEIGEADVYLCPELLDYADLKPIADLNLPQLRYEAWVPAVPAAFAESQGAGDSSSIFAAIRAGDVLVHHPYESFGASVEKFIRAAAEDPKTLAIKMTLYRTGDDSPFIPLLARAAERGKQVVVLIELKARFDEARNIHWAQELENSGVHVVYGVIGLKTHAKTALVVRQEGEGLLCYAHVGTGNYHKDTAKLYTDVGLFTAKPSFTEDVVELFHFLTGRSLKRNYRQLLVAPINMRDRFVEMIGREAEHAKAGRPARIIAKCNSLEDAAICRALYQASQAGVRIDLIVRGFCSLRPGVPGLSDNVRVISVIGRFLEHSRIFFFQNGQADPLDSEFFIGSADWMHRNLLARVEACAPIAERHLRDRLWEVLQTLLSDRRSAWLMQSDGSYVQFFPKTEAEELGTHRALMLSARARNAPGLEVVASAAGEGAESAQAASAVGAKASADKAGAPAYVGTAIAAAGAATAVAGTPGTGTPSAGLASAAPTELKASRE
jgi:polyphosphate kinase